VARDDIGRKKNHRLCAELCLECLLCDFKFILVVDLATVRMSKRPRGISWNSLKRGSLDRPCLQPVSLSQHRPSCSTPLQQLPDIRPGSGRWLGVPHHVEVALQLGVLKDGIRQTGVYQTFLRASNPRLTRGKLIHTPSVPYRHGGKL
jgi:hypothetical protein